MAENSPGFSLNMTKISVLEKNSHQTFPTNDENLSTKGEFPLDFLYI
jgi:hypothetical protein